MIDKHNAATGDMRVTVVGIRSTDHGSAHDLDSNRNKFRK